MASPQSLDTDVEILSEVPFFAGFSHEQLKLIAITGYGGEKNRQRAKKAGFDLHVTKPVSYEELARVFRASLSIRT